MFAALIPAMPADASGCRQPNVDPAAGCLGVAQDRLGARKRLAVFKPRDGGLAGVRPVRKLGLRQARAQASAEQLGGNLELRRERVILCLDLKK